MSKEEEERLMQDATEEHAASEAASPEQQVSLRDPCAAAHTFCACAAGPRVLLAFVNEVIGVTCLLARLPQRCALQGLRACHGH